MNIYENNKQLLTAMGGDSANLATDFEVRKSILDLLGGDSSNCNSIYEVDKQILNIYLEGGGGTGGDITLKPITITENGVYTAGVGNGYNEVTVEVPEISLTDITITENGVYTAGVGNGYNEVTVNVEIPECPEIPLTSITINSNGTYIPEEGGYNEVIVDVAGGGGGAVGEKLKVSSLKVNNDCIVDGTWNTDAIDTSNVTDMSSMFISCSLLQSLDVSGWDVSNVTTMNYLFSGCNSLQSLDVSGWDVSNVTTMTSTFSTCSSLQSLDVSGWDVSNMTAAYGMFSACGSLTTLIGGRTIEEVISNNISALNGLKINIVLTTTILDRASLRAIINGLADLTGSSAQTLTLGSKLMPKLTEEDIAVATAKNWTIA